MAKRNREINIFNIAFLDVITGAMGAFVLMVLLLAPYYTGASVATSQKQRAAQQAVDDARKNLQQAQQGGSSEETKKALEKAQADLDKARDQLDGLKQQLDQLSAQNKRLTALDDQQQRRIAQLERQASQATKEALDRAEQNMRQADKAIETGDIEELKRLLAQARADLAVARKQLAALEQQLDQAEAALQQEQNRNAALQQQLDKLQKEAAELSAEVESLERQLAQAKATIQQQSQQMAAQRRQLDEQNNQIAAQRQQITKKDQEIAYLKQHQGEKQQSAASPDPIVIYTSWSCHDMDFDVYVLSTYKPGVGPVQTDRPFDPATDPVKLVLAPDAIRYSSPEEKAGDRFGPSPSYEWVLLRGAIRQQIRIFYVLRSPLYLSRSYVIQNHCRVESRVTYGKASLASGQTLAPNSSDPVAWYTTFRILPSGNLVSDNSGLTDSEKSAVAAWVASKRDELHPLAAARAGRMTQAVVDALHGRKASDQFMINSLSAPNPVRARPFEQDVEQINSVLH